MNAPQTKIEVGALSETGYIRNENQDRMSGAEVPLGQLYVVADGMGGQKGGAIAADLTVRGLQRLIGAEPASAPVEKVIREAFKKVNETVYQKAHSNDPATEKMGSTAVLLLISGQVARLAHVGDSRAYLYRKRRLRQLTKDHTIVQKMVEAGMLKPEEAASHPDASLLERAIGSKESVEVDISDELTMQKGDAILLCSDGLSGYVTDDEIQKVLRSPATVQQVTEQLVKLALGKGGEDNITVQFVQYGPRKEALSRTTLIQKKKTRRPKKQRHTFLPTAVALLFFTVICAGMYFFFESKLTDTIGPIAKALNAAKLNADYAQKLREQLFKVEQDRDKISEAREKVSSRASRMEKSSKSIKKKLQNTEKILQIELKKIDEAKITADLELKNLREQVLKIEQDRNKINQAQGDLKLLTSNMEKDTEPIKGILENTEKNLLNIEKILRNTEKILQNELKKISEAKTGADKELKKLSEDLANG